MLEMKRSTHKYKTMEELKEKAFIKRERFYKRWNFIENKNDFSFKFKQLTKKIFILCYSVVLDDYINKKTQVFNLESGMFITIDGIATINIYDIPVDKESYK